MQKELTIKRVNDKGKLPSAKHNKGAIYQVMNQGGILFCSNGEFWVQHTFIIPDGAEVVVMTQ